MGMTRLALWSALCGVSIVEPMIFDAYEHEAVREWREGGESPHGSPWSTSLHASSFPGDDPLACGRLALYGLMDVPDEEPRVPRLTAMFAQGSHLEHEWVRRLAAQGRLLTADVTGADEHQTVFVDSEHWLTGACDAIILPAFWRKGHVAEIKTTSHEKLAAMRENPEATPFSHAKYLRQLKTYIGLAHEQEFAPEVIVCSESWAITVSPIVGSPLRWCPVHQSFECQTQEIALDPPDDGTLIYSSREEPLTTVSYYVSYDPEHMRAGRERLAQWRDAFVRGELPPHVHDGKKAKWTPQPCARCRYKRSVCKPDFEEGVTHLDASRAISFSKTIRPSYDYAAHRSQVLTRWGARDLAQLQTSTRAA